MNNIVLFDIYLNENLEKVNELISITIYDEINNQSTVDKKNDNFIIIKRIPKWILKNKNKIEFNTGKVNELKNQGRYLSNAQILEQQRKEIDKIMFKEYIEKIIKFKWEEIKKKGCMYFLYILYFNILIKKYNFLYNIIYFF